MSPTPFDLEAALIELRTEAPPPAARRRVQEGLRRRSRPRRWPRLAALSGALALLVLPLAFRSRGGSAFAFDPTRAIVATQTAPYAIVRNYRVAPDGRKTLTEESLWGPDCQVEKTFFDAMSLREVRRLPGLVFERNIFSSRFGNRPFETLRRTDAAPFGTNGKRGLFRFDDVRKHLGNVAGIVRLSGEGIEPDGEKRVRYRLALKDEKGVIQKGDWLWTLAMPSSRILRVESRSPDGSGTISDYEYPRTIATDRLRVPPLGWTWPEDFKTLGFTDPSPLPRFDLDRERAEIDRLTKKGLRETNVGGHGVKLVGVFQSITDPRRPLYVMYVAGEPGSDQAHPVKVEGFKESWGVTTMKKTAPRALATVFPAKGIVKRLDVEIPVYGRPGAFLGYARFENVPVRAYSNGLRSALRPPPFE